MIKCVIFDLDGVVVDTAKYHLLGWQRIASQLGFEFTAAMGEATKGVSRMVSLDIVLGCGGMKDKFTIEQKEEMAQRKNGYYLDSISKMDASELLVGVKPFILSLRECGIKVVLGSASKNARTILQSLDIESLFDHIVDGTLVTKAKPDPEVFLKGASLAGAEPKECVVFEDARAGVEAALAANMGCIAVGSDPELMIADGIIASFEGFTIDKMQSLLDS